MNWFKRLTGGLNKTASGIKKSIGSIFKGNKLDVSKLENRLRRQQLIMIKKHFKKG